MKNGATTSLVDLKKGAVIIVETGENPEIIEIDGVRILQFPNNAKVTRAIEAYEDNAPIRIRDFCTALSGLRDRVLRGKSNPPRARR